MQKYDGFLKLPHDIIQALIVNRMTGCESQLLHVILALTIGFNKRNSKITLSYFEYATGINRQQTFDLLKQLETRHIIIITRNSAAKNRDHNKGETPLYEINRDTTAWQSTRKNGQNGTKKIALGVYRKTSKENPPQQAIPPEFTEYDCYEEDHWAQNEYTPTPETDLALMEQHESIHPSNPPYVQPVHNVHNVQHVQPVQSTDASTPHSEISTGVLKNQYMPYQESSKPLLENQYDLYQNSSNIYKDNYKDNYKNITLKDNSLKDYPREQNLERTGNETRDERLNELILFSARECGMTIIGGNVGLLEQLLAIHAKQVIQEALLHFKSYQDVRKEQRMYCLSNNFRSFADKFDSFSTAESVSFLLQNEARWYAEAELKKREKTLGTGGKGTNQLFTTHGEGDEREEMATEAEIQEEEHRIARANYLVAKQYIKRIEYLAETDNTSVEQICKHLKEPIISYKKSKTLVDEYEKSEQAA